MRLLVIVTLPNAREPGYSKRSQSDDVCCAHVVDPRCDPASVVELPHIITGFVVAPNEDRQVGSRAGAGIVLVKVVHCVILLGHGDGFEVICIANGLNYYISSCFIEP